MRLCSNCGERPRRVGASRCTPCGGWWYSHGTERPLDLPYQPRIARDAPCSNCGERPHEYGSRRCVRCRAWYARHGRTERPAIVRTARQYAPDTPCVVCGETGRPLVQARCHRCYAYRHRTGRDRALPPRGSVPCQDCGQRPMDLHYARSTHQGLRRGRCHACYQRWWRAEQGRRWATPKYLQEQSA